MSDVQEPLEEEQTASPPAVPEQPPEPPKSSYEPSEPRRRRRPPSVFWPLVFIGAGVMLLLSNLGYLPWESWGVLWRLWPLLIIALGIDLLIGRRSMVGAIISAVLIFSLIGGIVLVALLAQNIPAVSNWIQPVSEWIQPPEFHTSHIEHSLTGVEQAEIDIDWSSVPGYLSPLEDSPNLIEGDIDYRGELTFDVDVRRGQADVVLESRYSVIGFWLDDVRDHSDKRWDVGLSPAVPLALTLDAGSGPCDFDLTDLQVSGLVLDAGSGPIDLILPSSSTFQVEIDGGSGPITITLPESVGARVELDAGSGPFGPDSRFRLISGNRHDDGTWETDNYDTAAYTVLLKIDQGSGPTSIR